MSAHYATQLAQALDQASYGLLGSCGDFNIDKADGKGATLTHRPSGATIRTPDALSTACRAARFNTTARYNKSLGLTAIPPKPHTLRKTSAAQAEYDLKIENGSHPILSKIDAQARLDKKNGYDSAHGAYKEYLTTGSKVAFALFQRYTIRDMAKAKPKPKPYTIDLTRPQWLADRAIRKAGPQFDPHYKIDLTRRVR